MACLVPSLACGGEGSTWSCTVIAHGACCTASCFGGCRGNKEEAGRLGAHIIAHLPSTGGIITLRLALLLWTCGI
jgi:hypothetical protein